MDLDATQLAEGPLSTWTNKGSIKGSFASPANAVPNVTTLQGSKGVTLNPTGTAQYYTGPVAPVQVTGGGTRTIEAWINNPVNADEETIFSWGRRGGPDGSNCSFNHGLNPTFGAVGHWGAGPDIGWNGRIAAGRWTYVSYTYDGNTVSVFMDGELVNSEASALDTWAFDNTAAGNPLPFRVGSQNEAAGTPTATLRATMTIGKIRVHDTPLTAQEIKSKFDQEKTQFRLGDSDNDGMPDWYEDRLAFLNPNEASDAAKDQDTDGLTNAQEFQRGTAPDRADTDGDGINDGAELSR
ncbi:MAG: LamG-like jellyroll fold domain-containing protein, partial [Phycisphaerales bacterium]|nr:LamG-like jellyroll fold domain-containing protein [Phycisphaerales bacterium]